MVFKLLENVFASQKNLSRQDNSLHPSLSPHQATLSLRFSSSPPRQGEITHSPWQNIFKDLSPHLQNGKGLVETIIGEETS